MSEVGYLGTAMTVATSNPTQTAAAAADTVYQFVRAFRHLVLQNNNTINLLYAIDQDSTKAGNQIYVLAPGQQIEIHRTGLAVHCNSSAQVNFGGTSGFTIEGFE